MADDRMNLYRLAEEALARYNQARLARPNVIGAGADVLDRTNALLGAPSPELDAGYGARVAPTPQATDADEARWRAWWGVAPDISNTRVGGLGAAAQASFDLAVKLKALRNRGRARSGGGGGGGGTAAPAAPVSSDWNAPGIRQPYRTPASESDRYLSDPFPTGQWKPEEYAKPSPKRASTRPRGWY